MAEAGIQDTNNDACAKKAACVARGYWADPFIQLFARERPAAAQ